MADVVINVGAVSAITAGTGLTGGTITGTGTIAASFGTSAGTICQGNDSRLTNGRAPTTHAATHATGGGDPVTLDQSQITDLTTDLAAKVASTRQVIAGTGMGGGGALSADVTLNVSYGTSGTTACVGNDARLSNARTPSTHASTHATGGSDVLTLGQSQITNLTSDLSLKASTTHAATHATGGTDVLTLGQAQITNLTTDLAARALGATTMTAGTGLTGGGDLSANRSFAVAYGTTSTTATVGNDARLSFIAAGTGATTRTLQNKLRDVISVKDFGATGDGSTNDTAAIQAALDARAGSSLYIPAGTYITTSALTISAGTYVYGDYTESIIAVQPTASATTVNNCIEFNGDDITVDNIKILGTNEGASVDGIDYTDFAKGFNIVGRTRPTITNCVIEKFCASIYCTNGVSTNSNTITITGNRIYGGIQPGDASVGVDAQDILIMGSNASYPNLVGRRSIIANNYCLGNTDCGINVCGNAGDTDFVISGNVLQPLALNGVTPLAAIDNKSRYGIITGYVGYYPARCVVSGNVLRDWGEAGIVSESFNLGGGQINITGNIISNCGFSVIYPADYSLKAAINVSGSADVISNNIIADCFRCGIQYQQNNTFVLDSNNPSPVISGNNISNIDGDPNYPTYPALGYGINVAGSHVSGALVANNRIARTLDRAIQVSCSAGAANGNCTVTGNLIDTNHAAASEKPALVIINSGGLDCLVSNNKINGSSVTDTYENIGIFLVGTTPIHTIGNVVNKYCQGIFASGFTPGRNLAHQCNGNVLTNCLRGIELEASPTNAGPWLISDNVFKTCTTNLVGGIWQGTSLYKANTPGNVLVSQSTVPTTGTWVVGDRVINSAPSVGSPKGWICTVAGTSGTWVSEDNLINPLTVAEVNALPAGVKVEGARGFCTDATVTTFASTVAGTGSNNVPVYYDGSAWKIG